MFNDLRPASYNRISFYVTGSDLNFGRRTVVHEYPQGDAPYVEDLGKATRKFTINAFILGDDYISKAKRLMKEFESPVEEGGGTLIHPWLGSLKVFPVDSPKITWSLEKRTAVLTLNFVEAGEHKKPGLATAWASYLLDKANELYDSILADLHIDEIQSYIEEVSELANTSLGIIKDSPLAKAFDMVGGIESLMSDMSEIMPSLDTLKDGIISNLSLASLASTTEDWQNITTSSVSACGALYDRVDAVNAMSPYASEKEQAINKGAASIEKAFRFMMLGNAVAGSSYIGSDLDQNLEGTQVKPFSEDVIEIRDNLMDALETEMRLLGKDEYDEYSKLADAHSAVYNYLTSVASDLGTVETYRPSEVTSSLCLAYEKYGDASRDLEIVQRNNIANPMFVPCEDIKLAVE